MGSSPLARGARGDRRRCQYGGRIIPARAGSTASSSSTCCWHSDHPRSRGEHTMTMTFGIAVLGSSPLARGARLGRLQPHPSAGIIPARAGSTRSTSSLGKWKADHPLSRAEHSLRRVGVLAERIIPARAGSTRRTSSATSASRDHPRSRGEHLPRIAVGSAHTDHPRSRGEHDDGQKAVFVGTGSSPLARGALDPEPVHGPARRIIPARAGSTASHSSLTG